MFLVLHTRTQRQQRQQPQAPTNPTMQRRNNDDDEIAACNMLLCVRFGALASVSSNAR